MSRAILSSAPHSLRGHLKITEQGEVIADRYANRGIALRHLEQLTNAVLMASSSRHEEAGRAAQERGAGIIDELSDRSAEAYRALVWGDPAFERYFVAATPIAELSGLTLGSRPSARAQRSSAWPWSSRARSSDHPDADSHRMCNHPSSSSRDWKAPSSPGAPARNRHSSNRAATTGRSRSRVTSASL